MLLASVHYGSTDMSENIKSLIYYHNIVNNFVYSLFVDSGIDGGVKDSA